MAILGAATKFSFCGPLSLFGIQPAKKHGAHQPCAWSFVFCAKYLFDRKSFWVVYKNDITFMVIWKGRSGIHGFTWNLGKEVCPGRVERSRMFRVYFFLHVMLEIMCDPKEECRPKLLGFMDLRSPIYVVHYA